MAGGGSQGLPSRAGKRKSYRSGYYTIRYPYNKLKRILRHNGMSAAISWADKNVASAILKRLVNEKVKIREE